MRSTTLPPRHRRKRRRKPVATLRPITDTLAKLAVAAELYACGKRLASHPIIVAIAERIGRDLPPMVAAIVVYCRAVDGLRLRGNDIPCLPLTHPTLLARSA